MRRLALALLMLVALPVRPNQHVNLIKGFNANGVYQFNDYDAVSAWNGNLTISIPIGNSYPIAEGTSFQLTLNSNGNVWEAEEYYGAGCGPTGTVAYAHRRANAGMGWTLSLGRLYTPDHPTTQSEWTYESPDGADHLFVGTANPLYTGDGTFLRMTVVSATIRTIEFPDGTKHYFSPSADPALWNLTRVTRPVGGTPGAVVEFELYRIEYTANTWKVIDAHGRIHELTFAGYLYDGVSDYQMIKSVKFADGGVYQFDYHQAPLGRQLDMHTVSKLCFSNSTMVSLLSSVTRPDGSRFEFKHYEVSYGIGPVGLPTKMTLPTGGTLEWQWFRYNRTDYNEIEQYYTQIWGVSKRYMHPPGSTSSTPWTYVYTGGDDDADPTNSEQPHLPPIYQKTTITDPAGKVTENFFDVRMDPISQKLGHHYGRPYTDLFSDQGRSLSQKILWRDPATAQEPNPPLKLRQTTYVLYEDDQPHISQGPIYGGRLKSQHVVQNDDGNRTVITAQDEWDGVGHYRIRTVSGTAIGVTRTTTTDYQQRPAANYPWITGLHTLTTTTESGGGSTTTASAEVCIDPVTGLVQSKRVKRGGDSTHDLYARFSYNGHGNRTEEAFAGGDLLPVSSNATVRCADIGTPAYKLIHAYSAGVRRETRYDGVSFKSADFEVNPATGLPHASLDVSGVRTQYEYDNMGRITAMRPAGSAWAEYVYRNASASAPASVTVSQWKENAAAVAGTELTLAHYYYDGFGRLVQHSRRMPDGWSTTWTEYDLVGRKVRETLPGLTATGGYALMPSGARATTWTYDAPGRVMTVTQADGKVVSYTYTGNRETRRAARIATADGEVPVPVVEEIDGLGRLIKVTESADVAPIVTNYAYDVGDRLRSVTIGSNPTPERVFVYDDAGLLKSEQHPESGTTTYAYDAQGHVVQRKTPLAVTTPAALLTYEYDPAERLKIVRAGGVKIKEFVFDRANSGSDKSLGKMDRATRYNIHPLLPGGVEVTEVFTYTGPGGAIAEKKTAAGTQTFLDKYEYDELGAVGKVHYPTCVGCTGLTAPPRTVSTTRSFGLTTQVSGYANDIRYHPNGMLSRIQHLNHDLTAGPLYEQFQGTDTMPRPGRIKVTRFCEDLVPAPPAPAHQAANPGATFTITITMPPGATLVQWYEKTEAGETKLDGATGVSLTRTADVTRSYFARVKNDTCSADSAVATVNVATSCATPASTIAMPEQLIANVTTTAAVSPTAGATYVWTLFGNGIINGSTTGHTVSFTPYCSGSVRLKVIVTTTCTAKTGETMDWVIEPPKASVSGSRTIPNRNNPVPIQLALSGLGPWQVNWSDGVSQTVPATTPVVERNVTPPTSSNVYTYYVTSITDGAGCAGTTDGSATITVATPTCTVAPSSDFDGPWPLQSSTIVVVAAAPSAETSYTWTVTNAQRLTESTPSRVRFLTGCSGSVTVTLTATSTNPSCGLSSTTTKSFPIEPPVAELKPELSAPNIYVRGDAPLNIKFAAEGVAPTLRWSDGVVQSRVSAGLLGQPLVLSRPVQPSSTTTYSIADLRDLRDCPGQTFGFVTVTVCDPPVVEMQRPAMIAADETATASVPALAGATYSWTISGGSFGGSSTTPTITFKPGTSCTQGVTLTATVTTSCGVTRTSVPTTIPVAATTAVVSGSATIAQRNSTSIRATLTGLGPWTVRWSDQSAAEVVTASPHTRSVTPLGTTPYTVASATDQRGCTALVSGEAVVTVIPPVPTAVTATAATPNQVAVTWSYSGDADQFVVYRNGSALATIATPSARSYTDSAVAPAAAYVYRVIAFKSGIASPMSEPDLATTIIFENEPLLPTQEIRAQHILQLRAAVTAVRTAAGSSTAPFTDTSLTGMKAIHFTELRTRLDEGRVLLGLQAIGYDRWPQAVVDIVWSTDIKALRGGVR